MKPKLTLEFLEVRLSIYELVFGIWELPSLFNWVIFTLFETVKYY